MPGMEKWEHLTMSFAHIKDATNDFKKIIGKGGYGWVYEGDLLINGRNIKVAVKRLNEQFGQGLKQFLTEIQLLSGQQHENIITLVGYCDEGNEKIIVYEYAQRGSLDQYIRPSHTNYTLTWLERLKIVVGAARGLDHLHNHVGEHKAIIHRDIKSSNILLDHNWVAKISDFGLSKLTSSGLGASTVISKACGTLNYLEPEYIRTGFVTKKSDVFSFGMVLFEVLCGRLCYKRDTDGVLLLADVAREYYTNNKLDKIIDPVLREQMSPESLKKYAAIAYRCLQDREHRPLMGVVKKELEETLNIEMHTYKIGTDDGSSWLLESYNHHDHDHPETEVVGSDQKLTGGPPIVSGWFNKTGNPSNVGDGALGSSNGGVKPNDNDEITLDVAEVVHSAKTAGGVDVEDQSSDSRLKTSFNMVDKDVGGERQYLTRMLSHRLRERYYRNPIRRQYEDLKYFLQDNWQRCWVIVLWIGIMVGLFTWKYIEYKHRAVYDVLGSCVCIAKGAAETLKLNMAIILLPVCRKTITWLRNQTTLDAVVPFDDNINFHKVIGVAIMIGVGLHAISHLTCNFPRLIHATEEEYKPMQQFFGDQAENYWHFLKEVEGYTGIIMIVLMTIAFTLATSLLRRNGLNLPTFLKKLTGFNAFWYSHHLFIIVYVMLIVHGIKLYLTKEWYKKTTWMYLAVPISLYACERLIRAFRSSVKPVKILKVVVYPGNVLALHMSKPQGFKYKSGQYMFVNCAAVSPFEWHPFYITSAPGDDYLSVHIRTLGDWTRELKAVFSKVCQPPRNGKSGLLRAEGQGENPNFPRIVIDGPYDAPTQNYQKYEVVLLVGLGIGGAPIISIVKDIMNNMKAKEEQQQNALENGVTLQQNKLGSRSENNFRTTRAYFYWVTREQGSFDWFRGVMNEAAEMDKNGVIEIHNYITSVHEEGDARSAIIGLLQKLNHAKNGVDVVSGTRVMSHFAKPNWRDVYKQIALNHTGSRIGVFYCGAPALTKELKQLALDFSHKTSAKFDFHKENF